VADSVSGDAGPLAWRVAPFQTALLFLIAGGCAALNIYGDPPGTVAGLTIVLGFAAFAFAVAGLRMYFRVDGDGVAVRYLRREAWLPWSEIDRIEIVSNVRGSNTIRFSRPDGTSVDVPPSLLQPSRPTSKLAASHLLKDVLRQIEDRRSDQ
jgi:hypothetical protein